MRQQKRRGRAPARGYASGQQHWQASQLRPAGPKPINPELLLSIAKLTMREGAFLDLGRERQAVLDRGVRPLSHSGWQLEGPVVKLWMGSRSIDHLIEGCDEVTCAIMFRVIEAVESLYPGRVYTAQTVSHDTFAQKVTEGASDSSAQQEQPQEERAPTTAARTRPPSYEDYARAREPPSPPTRTTYSERKAAARSSSSTSQRDGLRDDMPFRRAAPRPSSSAGTLGGGGGGGGRAGGLPRSSNVERLARPASAAAVMELAQLPRKAQWPFKPPQWPDSPKLGGVTHEPVCGTTFGSAERFCIGGIYWGDAKAVLPAPAKILIRRSAPRP